MSEEETHLLDPDDDDDSGKPRKGPREESEELPELPAPLPPSRRDEPSVAPIRIRELEIDHAKSLLRPPIGLAGSVFPNVDREEVEALVGATIDRIVSRSADGQSENISITELADVAGISRGRIGDRFGTELSGFANLVVRGIHAQAGRRVFYEQLESHPAKTGRRHNGEGSEKVEDIADNQLRMLVYSLGASDRHCPAESRILNMGTRWARSSPRFGANFPEWADEYRERLPDSFAEHFEELLNRDRAMRAAVLQALSSGEIALTEEITRERLIAAISQFLVVPLVPYGTSEVPYRRHHGIFPPGRDEATVQEAIRSRRHVILACGEPSMAERLEFEDDSESLVVGELPSMYELDIHKVHGVEYRWSPSRHELGRYQAGKGSRLEIWRLTGYDHAESFWRMLSLIERQAQVSWMKACTARWELDCMPGMQKAHVPEHCTGVRAFLKMANAGIVDALRRTGREV